MTTPPMYPAQAGSPITTLAEPYETGDTTITLTDASTRPAAPNLLCIEGGPGSAVLLYTGITGDVLTGIDQIEGPAGIWPAGSYAFRGFSAYDHDTIQEHITDLESADPLPTGDQGDLLYHDRLGWTSLPPGTDGQLLQSGGEDADPEWVNAVEGMPEGVVGDVPYHDGTGWGVENTGPLTTPTRTLILLGSSMMFPATNGAEYYEGALAGGRIVRGASFAASANDISAQIGHPMPSNWDGGTVKAEFLFATAATTGTVIFSLAGRASISDDALDGAFGTAQSVIFNIGTQAGKAAWDLWTTDPTNPITLAGSPQGSGRRWVQWEITRDAADTCAEDVLLLAVVVEYGTDGFGDA